MSLFSQLGLGTSGLNASQMALDVTGQNITNANTEGYSRKRVNLATATRKDDYYGQMGMGVDTSHIERARNQFLDVQIDAQKSREGYFGQIDGSLERIENIFGELGALDQETATSDSLGGYLNDFWNAWQNLANNPSELSAREQVFSTTKVLTAQFHSLAGELADFKTSTNNDIEDHVNIINNLTAEISKLNDEVALVEIDGTQKANDSRDRRTQLLKQLSQEIPVDFFEDDDGRITVTTKGNIIVGPRENIEIQMFRREDLQDDGTMESKVFLQYANTRKEYVPTDGAVAGVFETRDEIIPKYEEFINEMARTLVTEVNKLHEMGYDLEGDTGLKFFDPTKTDAQNISLSANILDDTRNIAAGVGGKQMTQGGAPLAMTVTAANNIDVTDLAQGGDPRFRSLVNDSVKITLNPSGIPLEEGAGKDFVVDYSTGVITFVNPAIINPGDNIDVEFLYNEADFGGVGDGEMALKIAQLSTTVTMKEDSLGNATQSINEFYDSFIGALGVERMESSTNLETHEYMLLKLEQQQQSVAGVSLDEEMANMIKFEHTYQASAKYISSINQMLDVLLNLV